MYIFSTKVLCDKHVLIKAQMTTLKKSSVKSFRVLGYHYGLVKIVKLNFSNFIEGKIHIDNNRDCAQRRVHALIYFIYL